MRKILNKIYKGGVILDAYSLFLFILVSCCFSITNKIILPLVIIVSCFQFYRYFKNQISATYFFTTFFYLLIYSSIFYGSIHKIILIVLLLFLSILYFKRTSTATTTYTPEIIVLIFFGLILINHLIFPPYLRGLDVHIYYLLMPLLFLGIKKQNFTFSITASIKVYISSILVATFLLIFFNIYHQTLTLKTNTFFSKHIGIIHVYYGMFLGIACCFLLTLYSKGKQYYNPLIDSFIFLILISLLAYTGARISLIAVVIAFILFLYKKAPLKWYVKSPLLLFFLIGLIYLGSKVPRVQYGIKEVEKVYTSIKKDKKQDLIENSWRNMNQRFLVTTYTIEEIKEHLFFGIGIQNVKHQISNKIISDGYKYFKPINSHNQYLNVLVSMGIFVFLYFLYMLLFLIKQSNNASYFIVFFLIIMCTESILVRGKGISLFFLFSLIFLVERKLLND